MSNQVHRIVLELDDGAVPVTGRLCTPGDAPRPFVGWTALISALITTTESSVALVLPE